MDLHMETRSIVSIINLIEDDHCDYLAEINLQSGEVQRPSWTGLHRYWSYAKPSQVEYSATSHTGHFAVFCFSVSSGQGGIIAIWNTLGKRWEQVSEASYVACAMLLDDLDAIISLHYISSSSVPGHHAVYATPFDRVLDSCKELSLPIVAEYSQQDFDFKKKRTINSCFGNCCSNKHGALGIFLLDDGCTLIAHDAGNLYQFSLDAVKNALARKS